MVDEIVKRAMAKWPNAPALFGWLRLDRRGHWYLRGERIELEPLKAFIERNYAGDEHGRWYFQNGPQRAFVALDYAPWILFSQPDGSLLAHTGQAVKTLSEAYLDEHGRLVVRFERGAGLLSETDLDWALDRVRAADGGPLGDAALAAGLEALQAGGPVGLGLEYQGSVVPLAPLRADEVPARLGFVREPEPLPEEPSRS